MLSVTPFVGRKIGVATVGKSLSTTIPHLSLFSLGFRTARPSIWHARRNLDLFIGVMIKKIFRKKIALLFTSSSPRKRSRWTRFLLEYCDGFVATNEVNAIAMSGPCHIISHGVDTKVFRPRDSHLFSDTGHKLVGSFGRIRHAKGTADFVDALCIVLPQHPDWIGVIMGRAMPKHRGFLAELKEKIKTAGLADRIEFHEEQETSKMPEAYSALSLYVCPSHYEGFGLTPIEAVSCGVPVIATKGVGTFDDQIVEGETGFLFQPSNATELAAQMSVVMEDPELLSSMSAAARPHVQKNFSIEQEADELVSVYEKILLKCL